MLSPPHERMLACLGMAGLTATERIVLAVIASFDGPGGAWPGQALIASVLNMDERHVRKLIASARDKGAVRVKKGQRSSVYTIDYQFRPAQIVPDRNEAQTGTNRTSRPAQIGTPDRHKLYRGTGKNQKNIKGASLAAPTDRAVTPSTESGFTGKEKGVSLSSPSIHPRETERENQPSARCASNGKGKGSPATAKQRAVLEMHLGKKYGADIPAEAYARLAQLNIAEASHMISTQTLTRSSLDDMADVITRSKARHPEADTAAKAAGTGREAEPDPDPVALTVLHFETDTDRDYRIGIDALVAAHPGLSADRAWELLGGPATGRTPGPGDTAITDFADGRDVNRYVSGLLRRAGFPRKAEG